jgi:hypothetical protein
MDCEERVHQRGAFTESGPKLAAPLVARPDDVLEGDGLAGEFLANGPTNERLTVIHPELGQVAPDVADSVNVTMPERDGTRHTESAARR